MGRRVLGVDPGTRAMGFAVVEEGDPPTALEWGVLTPPRRFPLERRLAWLLEHLEAVAHRWAPCALAVEEPYTPREGTGSARSALAVGQAQAVALLVAGRQGLPVHRYTAPQVKRAVAHYGRGTKEQVAEMVRRVLGLPPEPLPPDAGDALAVALCHLWAEAWAERLEAGG